MLLLLLLAGGLRAVETPISPETIGPTSAGAYYPNVVALGDGFLAVWTEGSGCAPKLVRGMRLDRDGHARDVSFGIVPGHQQITVIGVESDGDDAFVLWKAADLAGTHLSRVGADGTVAGLADSLEAGVVAMRISNGKILLLSAQQYVGDPLTVTLLDRDGTLIRRGVKVADATSVREMDVVATRTGFVLAWTSSDGVRATRFSTADVAANRVPITPVVRLTTTAYPAALRMASDGVRTMAFWNDVPTHELRAVALLPDGTPAGAPVLLGLFPSLVSPSVTAVSNGYLLIFLEQVNSQYTTVSIGVSFDGTLESVHRTPAITRKAVTAHNGDRSVAVWDDLGSFVTSHSGLEVLVAPIASDGSIGSGSIISLSPAVQHMRKLVPFRGGTAALWTESVPNDRLVAGRIGPSGVPIDGSGFRLRESNYDQTHSALATDGELLFVVWTEGLPDKANALYGAIVTPGAPPIVRQLASDAAPDAETAVVWNGQSFTIVYQRDPHQPPELLALRVDRSGNALDPQPIVLTPGRGTVGSPYISWNGSEYLLVWQRLYDPFFYIGEQLCSAPVIYPAELFAQRFDAALAPSGPVIELLTTNNYNTILRDAQSVDVAFAGGLWLVSWSDPSKSTFQYARIDTNSTRLDPLYGRQIEQGLGMKRLLASTPSGWLTATREGSGEWFAPTTVALSRIGFDGVNTVVATIAVPDLDKVEAFALSPAPVVAYTRSNSAAVYIDTFPQRARAIRR